MYIYKLGFRYFKYPHIWLFIKLPLKEETRNGPSIRLFIQIKIPGILLLLPNLNKYSNQLPQRFFFLLYIKIFTLTFNNN